VSRTAILSLLTLLLLPLASASLTHHYGFNDTWADTVGADAGEPLGSPSFITKVPSFNTSGAGGNASGLFSNGQSVTALNSANFNADWSYSLWFRHNDTGEDDYFLGMDTGSDRLLMLTDCNNDWIYWMVRDGSSANQHYAVNTGGGETCYDDDAWHHIIFAYDYDNRNADAGYTIYIDGSQKTLNHTKAGTIAAVSVPGPLIGARNSSSVIERFFTGYLDEVKFFDHTVNGVEAANLYNYGNLTGVSNSSYSPGRLVVTYNTPSNDQNGTLNDGFLVNVTVACVDGNCSLTDDAISVTLQKWNHSYSQDVVYSQYNDTLFGWGTDNLYTTNGTHRLAVQTNRHSTNVLTVFDVTNMSHVNYLGSYSTNNYLQALFQHPDNPAWVVASDSNTHYLLNITNPASISLLDSEAHTSESLNEGIYLKEGIAAFAGKDGYIHFANLSVSGTIVDLGRYDARTDGGTNKIHDLTWDGNRDIFCGNRGSTSPDNIPMYRVFDSTGFLGTANIQYLGSASGGLTDPNRAIYYNFSGSEILFGDSNAIGNGLSVYNVTNRASPTLITTLSYPNGAASSGFTLFPDDEPEFIHAQLRNTTGQAVIDISDVADPKVLDVRDDTDFSENIVGGREVTYFTNKGLEYIISVKDDNDDGGQGYFYIILLNKTGEVVTGCPSSLLCTDTSVAAYNASMADGESVTFQWIVKAQAYNRQFLRVMASSTLGEVNASYSDWREINITKPSGSGSPASGELNNNVVLSYTMDSAQTNNQNVTDNALDNDGILINATVNHTGLIDEAYHFNNDSGYDDYVWTPDDDSFDFGTENFTISVWLKTNQTSTGNVFDKRYPAYRGYYMAIVGGLPRFYVTNGVLYNTLVTASTNISDETWHHLVAVRGDGNLSLYIDGVLDSTTASNATEKNIDTDSDSTLGTRSSAGDSPGVQGTNGYSGFADELLIYNVSLTASNIAELYDQYWLYGNQYPFPTTTVNGSRQIQNLTAIDRQLTNITLSWDDYGETNYTELYRDGVNIVNTSNTTYTDTGLSQSTSYTYWGFAVGLDGTRNTTSSSENNITASTTFNNTVNIYIYNEVTKELLNGTNVSINMISNVVNQTGSTTNGTLTFTGILDGDYTIRHTADGWGLRDQYQTIQANGTLSISLYLINDSYRGNVVVTVTDTRTNELPGSIIKLTRYYGSCNCYETVEMATTKDDGTALMSAQLYDAFYRWIIEYDGVTRYITTTPESLYPDTSGLAKKFFQIDINNNIYTTYNLIEGVTSSVTYNNATSTLTYTWSDSTGVVTAGCLIAEYANGSHYSRISNCGTGGSGSVLLTLPDTANKDYRWIARLNTTATYGPTFPDLTGAVERSLPFRFGVLGGFVYLALLTGGVFLFSFSAFAVIVYVAIMLIVSAVLHFSGFALIPLGSSAVIAIVVALGGIAISLFRK
jgi:hypothetical protein